MTIQHGDPAAARELVETIRDAIACGVISEEPAWEFAGDPEMVAQVMGWVGEERVA